MSDRFRASLLNIAALAVGVLVAVVAVATYQWFDALPKERLAIAEGGTLLVSASSQARIAAVFALLTAFPIIAVCLPVWALLAKFQMNTWFAAGALGLTATVVAWVIFYDLKSPLAEALTTGLPYGFCGALAGVAAWAASPRRRADR